MEFKDKLRVIGLMSGTSCDGLDIALIEVSGSGENLKYIFLAGKTITYSQPQKNSIVKVLSSDKIDIKYISQLNFYLAQIWAEMVISFLKEIDIPISQIDLVSSHGQTIWHQPASESFNDIQVSSTLQIGDPSVLANILKIPVVGDFRIADVALGGQGAPLIPYYDWVIFKNSGKNILSINIGGMSNFTLIPKSRNFNDVEGFDCGPGNVLIDMAMQELYNKSKDENGAIAFSGELSDDLLHFIKSVDNFVESKPPKSTGRELYNKSFIHRIIEYSNNNRISNEDIIHTLSEYTVFAIHTNYHLFIEENSIVEEIVVSGGGINNLFIMDKLNEYFPNQSVNIISDYGIDNDLKEAIGFAILANETVKGNPSNIPNVTGAKKPTILGKFCII